MSYLRNKNVIAIVLAIIVVSSGLVARVDYSFLKEGDIIFHESVSGQATAVKLATHSRYTHAGIIFRYHDEWKVLEAVQPVKITALDSFINRGLGRHFVIKRLGNRDALVAGGGISRMKKIGNSFIGKNYDIYFGWSDDRIYCTELIWKIYKRALNVEVGRLEKLKEFDLSDARVKRLMKKRYGNSIPYNEPVISPESMFRAKNLVTVVER